VELAITDSQPKGWLFGFFQKLKKFKLANTEAVRSGGVISCPHTPQLKYLGYGDTHRDEVIE
jgi:hypothetical protein